LTFNNSIARKSTKVKVKQSQRKTFRKKERRLSENITCLSQKISLFLIFLFSSEKVDSTLFLEYNILIQESIQQGGQRS